MFNDDVFGFDGGDGVEYLYFFIFDIFGWKGDGFFYGEECKDLEKMVLYNVMDDVKFVKVIVVVFGVEWFFEGDLDIVDVVFVLGGIEEWVIELKDENVFDYFFV